MQPDALSQQLAFLVEEEIAISNNPQFLVLEMHPLARVAGFAGQLREEAASVQLLFWQRRSDDIAERWKNVGKVHEGIAG